MYWRVRDEIPMFIRAMHAIEFLFLKQKEIKSNETELWMPCNICKVIGNIIY